MPEIMYDEKLTKVSHLHDICPKYARILHYVCPKNIFSGIFLERGQPLARGWDPGPPPAKSGPAATAVAFKRHERVNAFNLVYD